MEAKKWWTSKLVWLGVLQIATGIVEFIGGLPPAASATTIIAGILTIILRVITSQPISGTPGAKPGRK